MLFGGMEIIAGRLTIGQFIIISSYFNIMLGAMRYFFNLGNTVQNNLVSYNRLMELSHIGLEHNGTLVIDNVNRIELRQVSFSYGDKPIVNDVNLIFEKGNIYTIMGKNGAGKSTLIDIILGLQVNNFAGQVLFNDVSMENLDMYNLRNLRIGVSEQEPVLLADTLRYNLEMDVDGRVQLQSSEFNFLTNMLGLDRYINSLPNQYETLINENAINISGGEKQKISILRAILKNTDILILDEPTSALDDTSKNALKNYLHTIKQEKIIILVTHDDTFMDEEDVQIIKLN